MNKKTLEVLRWIAVLPAVLVCVVLVMFPIHWMVMLIHSNTGENSHMLSAIPPDILERFGYAFFTPLIMIYVGARVAPRFKFETGIALAILWGIFFGAAMMYAASRGLLEQYGWLRLTITIALGITGVIAGLYQGRKAVGLRKG